MGPIIGLCFGALIGCAFSVQAIDNCLKNRLDLNGSLDFAVIPIQIPGGRSYKCHAAGEETMVFRLDDDQKAVEHALGIRVLLDVASTSPALHVTATNGHDLDAFSVPELASNDQRGATRVLLPFSENPAKPPIVTVTPLKTVGFIITFFQVQMTQYQFLLSASAVSKTTIPSKLKESGYLEHQVISEVPGRLLRIRINSSDPQSCMRIYFRTETEALRHNALLSSENANFVTMTSRLYLDLELPTEPLQIRYVLNGDDEECGTIWESPKQREKQLQIHYELVEYPGYGKPILALVALFFGVASLPVVVVASPILLAVVKKSLAAPQDEESLAEALPGSGEDTRDSLLVPGGPIIPALRGGPENELEWLGGGQNSERSDEVKLKPGEDYELFRDREKPALPLAACQFAVFLLPPILQEAYGFFTDPAPGLQSCYHNFACARPLGRIASFNHIISNLGYVFVGVLYLVFQRKRAAWFSGNEKREHQFGVYRSPAVDMALGVSLMCEAVASAVYHLCPSKSAYKFDTPFIVSFCVLAMLRLYGSRHGPPTHRHIQALIAGTLAVDFCMQKLAEHLPGSWPLQAVFFLALLLGVLIKIYSGKHVMKFLRQPQFLRRLWLNYRSRLLLGVLGINVSLAAVYFFVHRYLHSNQLIVFFAVTNLLLYVGYYLVNKVHIKERISRLSGFAMLISCILWAMALIAFTRQETDWAVSPALSRDLNSECSLFDFFDQHDIWHVLSALAAGGSLLALATVDDPTATVPRANLVVF